MATQIAISPFKWVGGSRGIKMACHGGGFCIWQLVLYDTVFLRVKLIRSSFLLILLGFSFVAFFFIIEIFVIFAPTCSIVSVTRKNYQRYGDGPLLSSSKMFPGRRFYQLVLGNSI